MPGKLTLKSIEILLVEDNPGDARLAMEAMKATNIRNTIHHVPDGEEAMKFLRQVEPYRKTRPPDLILLDLNLPKKDGHQVLAEIKRDDFLKRIPVIIFTGSTANEDILTAYNNYASCYISKPLDLDQFQGMIRLFKDFWLTIVKFPEAT